MITFSRLPACTSAPQAHKKAELSSVGICDKSLWARTYGAMERFGDPPNTSRLPYDPYKREVLRHRCVMNVLGRVTKVLDMSDGDVKIWLSVYESNFGPQGVQLPPGLSPLVRSELLPDKSNELIAEVVCAAKPQPRGTGKDPKTVSPQNPEGLDWKIPGIMSPVRDSQNEAAVNACRYYTNTITRPHVGELIYVSGELVKDTGPERNKDPNTMGIQPFVVGHGHYEIHPVTLITR